MNPPKNTPESIAWIGTVDPNEAEGPVHAAYEAVKTPHGTVDNVMRVHSLRPHTMHGHLALYRSVLHHPDNSLPLWFLEAVASYTSVLNRCVYSFTHHFANTARLLENAERAEQLRSCLEAKAPERFFDGKELALMRYAGKLTVDPGGMREEDCLVAKRGGATDGEILEVNQVCAYFNYSNRLLNGLGVSLAGDEVGYYKEGSASES